MARVFLDTNVFFEFLEKDPRFEPGQLKYHDIYVSPLSIHIFAYVRKLSMPQQRLINVMEECVVVPFSEDIVSKSIEGPTGDLEDNVQLHSAAAAGCDYFLTRDRELLKMAFFGKTRVVSSIYNG